MFKQVNPSTYAMDTSNFTVNLVFTSVTDWSEVLEVLEGVEDKDTIFEDWDSGETQCFSVHASVELKGREVILGKSTELHGSFFGSYSEFIKTRGYVNDLVTEAIADTRTNIGIIKALV